MPRVKRGAKRREKRKKLLARAKGYFLGKSKLYKFAKEATERAGNFAYTGRKRKKRDFRRLWIIRINAAARAHETSYSQLMAGLKARRHPARPEVARRDRGEGRPRPSASSWLRPSRPSRRRRQRPAPETEARGAHGGRPARLEHGQQDRRASRNGAGAARRVRAGGAGGLGLGRAAGPARPLPRPQVGSALGAAEVARAGRRGRAARARPGAERAQGRDRGAALGGPAAPRRAAAAGRPRPRAPRHVAARASSPRRPPPPADGGAPGARGHLRGDGLRGLRRPGGRGRLPQLRGPQHAARPPGARHAGHLLPRGPGRAAAAHPHLVGPDPLHAREPRTRPRCASSAPARCFAATATSRTRRCSSRSRGWWSARASTSAT